jgi:ubiquinone/menaquinone biosynthesis C-methylase UbiE
MTTPVTAGAEIANFDYEQYQYHLDIVRSYGPTARFMDGIIRRMGTSIVDMDVLDLGCGTGHISRMFEGRNRVVSYDPTVQGVRTARALQKTRGSFVVGGGERLPFADATFDVVLLIDVLEHIEDHQSVAAEIQRVLRPGGLVFCMVPQHMNLYSRIDAANGHVRRYERQELLDIFSPCTTEVLFDYGFPFMRFYLWILSGVHDEVVPTSRPVGLKRIGLNVLSGALKTLFTVDLLFSRLFLGVELVALLRTPTGLDARPRADT